MTLVVITDTLLLIGTGARLCHGAYQLGQNVTRPGHRRGLLPIWFYPVVTDPRCEATSARLIRRDGATAPRQIRPRRTCICSGIRVDHQRSVVTVEHGHFITPAQLREVLLPDLAERLRQAQPAPVTPRSRPAFSQDVESWPGICAVIERERQP